VIVGVSPVHIRSYRNLDEIAEEKITLLNGLQTGGMAIVNGNDPRLECVKSNSRFTVRRFGVSETDEFQANASDISSRWPDRLSFQVEMDGISAAVSTRLVGGYWVPSLMAAILAADLCGVPLVESSRLIRDLKPFDARLQPVRLPGGAVVFRDEYNASEVSFEQAFKVFREAKAARKVLIAADMADSQLKTYRRNRKLGRSASKVFDLVIFVGEHTRHARKGAEQGGLPPEKVHDFVNIAQAVEFLRKELQEGDLVLLKGQAYLHLSRILFGLVGEVSCKKPVCKETFLCDICWKLGTARGDREKMVPI
jgi:UDP-N-acetylmuramoyl-tripeptide--D-alanyl-D-alanine ligase